jgi:hypothetical protein
MELQLVQIRAEQMLGTRGDISDFGSWKGSPLNVECANFQIETCQFLHLICDSWNIYKKFYGHAHRNTCASERFLSFSYSLQ